MKIKIGLDQKNDERVYKALNPIIDNLAQKIKSYISFYHEHATHVHGPDGAIGQVILCGGDSLLNNLPEVLTEKLGLPVKMGNPLANVKSTMPKRESFVYTTAIGLALRELL